MIPDCLVIGGGPAGLTAAIYLARFRLAVTVIDAGNSRAATIPLTRNHAGFPDGIAGIDLIGRMREQAGRYGARAMEGQVASLERRGELFLARFEGGEIAARAILLATGVVNRRPDMPAALHDQALARGLIRYCPVCDGYEVTDRAVAVIGTGERGVKEALFLRAYTADLTLIAPDGPHAIDPVPMQQLADAGIAVEDGPCTEFAIHGERIEVTTPQGKRVFDSLYPALGSDVRSELAADLGADRTGDGCLIVDSHQRTSVPGLYAAGDVVIGLDQISHAMGEGGVAATTIRNDLAQARALWR